MICDFCSAPKPVWKFQERPSADRPEYWAACETCAKIILTEQLEPLVERALLSPGLVIVIRFFPEMKEVLEGDARRLLLVFLAHRTGEPVRIDGKEQTQ